jgi:hypothetical protein
MSTIRVVQAFTLITFSSDANANRYGAAGLIEGKDYFTNKGQNYFINETKVWNGENYGFVPFRTEGTSSSLNGENTLFQMLLPNQEVVLRLVEMGNGNRLSRLLLTTSWLNESLNAVRSYEERYIGVGCSYSETTIELRFRSAMDSVGAEFPGRKLSRNLVGILPLSADVFLQ